MTVSRDPAEGRVRSLSIASMLQLMCGMVLLFDLGGELHAALLHPSALSPAMVLHLGTELLATAGLAWALWLVRVQVHRSRAELDQAGQKLRELRGDFDEFLRQRFAEWNLSQAEADVALLTVRGLKISRIAEIRDTREGTVKSQLHAIFRKSGVTTRTEFVALFIDEFLDLSARQATEADPALRQRP